MPRYEVTVSRTTIESQVITVVTHTAEEAEARALAVAKAFNTPRSIGEWSFYDDSFEVVDVYDCDAED